MIKIVIYSVKMKMFCTLLLCFTIVLDATESSSQFERMPDGGNHSVSSPPTTEQTARVRSRSPTLRRTFPSVLGHKFEDLEIIRLIPHNNPNQMFELRKYVFPPDKPILLRTRGNAMNPMPTGEQIVLSTTNGDVCAILEKLPSRNTILRPMFAAGIRHLKRMKINMNSGRVEDMTEQEIEDCPVSLEKQVAKMYGVLRLSSQPSSSSDVVPNPAIHDCEPSASSSGRRRPCKTRSLATPGYSARTSPPAETRVPNDSNYPTLKKAFKNVLGYKFDDLAFIRLRPHNEPNRVFQFQRYIFPPNKPIGLRKHNGVLEPMPTGDQLVLSTSTGDACAILLKFSNRSKYLRPMFSSILGILERVKINIRSGMVQRMTEEEISECPVTTGEPITQKYDVSRV